MIASTIGRTFLDSFNELQKKRGEPVYSAESFFDEVFFPLFYDDEKYMQWVHGSPFFQLSSIQKKQHLPEKRRETFLYLKEQIHTGVVNGSMAPGFPAGNRLDSKGEYFLEFATTSSQVSTLNVPIDSETMYFSWIGSGFGIGIQGGLCIFFDDPQILMLLYEGWVIYRNSYLNRISKLKGSQIETWNGQWLAHRLSEDYLADAPLLDFTPVEKTGEKLGTQSWLRIIAGIAFQFSYNQLIGYIFSYGQTNRSIGFIPFVLPQIKKPITLFRELFDTEVRLRATEIENILGTEYGFLKACEMGVIGIKAMEPKGVRAYLGFDGEAKIPKYIKTEQSQPLNFSVYITWIIAMLNNEELWNKAEEYAKAFVSYEEGAGKAKKDRTNDVLSFLKSSFQRSLIDTLSVIVDKAENKLFFEELGKTIHFLPKDNVPYFIALIRFRYAFLKK
jgi:hypothetical protein